MRIQLDITITIRKETPAEPTPTAFTDLVENALCQLFVVEPHGDAWMSNVAILETLRVHGFGLTRGTMVAVARAAHRLGWVKQIKANRRGYQGIRLAEIDIAA